MSAATAALSVSDLSRRYGERVAVHGVSFELLPGELVALIGPNGAGKTTLLSMLAGVLSADAGSVQGADADADADADSVQGADAVSPQGADAASLDGLARGVGWVPQQPAIYTKLTVAENLRLWARLERVSDPQETVRRMLDQIDLTERADEQVGRLSGGNRQRVNIAVGLLSDPAVLLLDEPSAALDPLQRERLWEFVQALAARGTSVIFSTHNVTEAERYAQRILVLDEGELLFDGPPAVVMGEESDFEDAFVAFLRSRRAVTIG